MKKFLISVFFSLLFAAPALGHHLWIAPDNGAYTINRGMINERTDPYDPVCVKDIRAYAGDGSVISVKRTDRAEEAAFKTEEKAAAVSVVSKWGDRVMTTRGKKLMNRQEAESKGFKVISAFFSTQFSKALFAPSPLNRKPAGLKFEIVPMKDPLGTAPGESLPVKLLFDGAVLPETAVFMPGGNEYKTDENGIARIDIADRGIHLLYSIHETPPGSDSAIDSLKYMTFLTFEVK